MSQHWYEVKSNQGIVQVMLGWDPPLQWFHMCIDYDINAAEDPLYTNLAEPDRKRRLSTVWQILIFLRG